MEHRTKMDKISWNIEKNTILCNVGLYPNNFHEEYLSSSRKQIDFRPLLCKILCCVVLFCSIVMQNAVTIHYLLFLVQSFYRMVQRMSTASFTGDSFHSIDD